MAKVDNFQGLAKRHRFFFRGISPALVLSNWTSDSTDGEKDEMRRLTGDVSRRREPFCGPWIFFAMGLVNAGTALDRQSSRGKDSGCEMI